MRTLVTGATGLLGSELLARLDDPVVLTRDAVRARDALGLRAVHAWNATAEVAPREAFDGVDVVLHLAGEPAAERWTDAKKERIRDSRVKGTANLVAGLAAASRRPSVLVSASAVGFYGDRGDALLDESSSPGSDFLAEVCVGWEREAMAAEALGVRVVCLRIGVVLTPRGGALARMLPPFRLGVGGRLGDGTQWMPWVHPDDVVGLLLHVARSADARGAWNAVSPNPVTNRDFTRALGHALHRPALVPVPVAALRLAFGEMSEILVASQRVVPRAALTAGYVFQHPTLEGALAALLPR